MNRVAPSLRVLFLEDQPDDMELIIYLLEKAGYTLNWERVETESDYREKLAIDPDIILADYTLPGFDALHALKILQEKKLDIPFIVISGTISEEIAVECMKMGAADYLLKDRLARLEPAVVGALQEKALRDENRIAEQALRESEARFRRLAENAQDVIYIYQLLPNRGFEYVSPAATTIVGYTPQEHYEDPDLIFKLVHEDDRAQIEQLFQIRAHRFNPLMVRWIHKDGSIIWVEQRVVPIYNAQGRLQAIEGIARDITEQKESEAALQRAHDELEYRVNERTAELYRSNILLQQEITERKRIEIAEREQRTLAEALRDTAEALNSTLNLDEVLERILNNVGKVVQHDAANIMLIDSSLAKVQRHKGYVALQLEIADNYSLPVMEVSNLRWMYETGMPLVVPDTLNHTHYSNVPNTPLLRSYAGAPIVLDEAVIGFINLNSINPDFFNETHIQRLQAFSDQAAVAIKNARLYEQAKHVAVIEERNRLARDLHDAVSQTLWSASLIADMLPRVWQQDPVKGEESLEELRQLSRNALSEMRALLIELRPGALVEKPLQELLYQLSETIKIRSGLNINLETDATNNLSPEVQVAFYRIAQETLNNIMRHGEAKNVHVRFLTYPEWAELEISDDGKGFDINNIPPGHMGISIMRERANAIGAKFDLKSSSGNGTRINITWQKVDEDE